MAKKRVFRYTPYEGLPKGERSPVAKKKSQNKTGPGSEDGSVRPQFVKYVAAQYPKARLYVAKDSNMKGAGNVFRAAKSGHPDTAIYCPRLYALYLLS